MLNAAVIGLGWWGKQIVTCLADSDRIAVRRGVDVNLDDARGFAAVHGFDVGDSYDDVLADDDIDAVILVTPHALHEEQVLAAAAAGKQIFCEKPFALSTSAPGAVSSPCLPPEQALSRSLRATLILLLSPSLDATSRRMVSALE